MKGKGSKTVSRKTLRKSFAIKERERAKARKNLAKGGLLERDRKGNDEERKI